VSRRSTPPEAILFGLTVLLVAIRIVANPVANVFQKQLAQRGASPLFIIGATHALLTVAVLPVVVRLAWPPQGSAFWGNMWLCAVLAVAGNVLLVFALRGSDLSILGPVNAYKAVLSLVLAIFVLGEIPSAAGLAGVLLILAGSYLVMDRAPGQGSGHAVRRFIGERGVQFRFAALACSATEAVFLKRAMLDATPGLVFLAWSVFGLPIAGAVVLLLHRRGVRRELALMRLSWTTYAWLAITVGLMQLTTLITFGTLQVGYALALFQLSTLVSVVLGHQVFRERDIRRRLAGSAVMVAGAALIVALGRSH
jgi:drug/metabolite transporter (DMT)-like permease